MVNNNSKLPFFSFLDTLFNTKYTEPNKKKFAWQYLRSGPFPMPLWYFRPLPSYTLDLLAWKICPNNNRSEHQHQQQYSSFIQTILLFFFDSFFIGYHPVVPFVFHSSTIIKIRFHCPLKNKYLLKREKNIYIKYI